MVEPPGETSAAIESVTSRSRSVAFRLSLPLSALTKHVGQNWNGIAPLDHAMDVAQRLQKLCTLDCHFHWETRLGAFETDLETRRNDKPALAECEAGEQR